MNKQTESEDLNRVVANSKQKTPPTKKLDTQKHL